jgi:hypothetical protein
MYPRNAASPEPIAIGTVLLTADGTVQTSGVTVRIKPVGVAEADGAGTVSYSTDGVVFYTPTQSETNYTSFILIAKKTSCIPVAITVVTSATSVAGTVDVGRISGDATAADNAESFFDGTGYAGTNNVIPTVTTVTNKTGYELSGTGVTAVQSGLATSAALTVVDDFLDTEIAAIKAKTDNLPADPADASDIAAAFSTVNSTLSTLAGYLDTEIAAILADTNELQTDWANGGRLDNILDARASQASVDTIDDFLDTEIAAIKVATDRFLTMIVLDGAVYQYTANALELAPAGGGGGGSGDASQATLLEVKAKTDLITEQSVFVTQDRVSGNTITMYWKESTAVTVSLDEDVTAKTLRFVVEGPTGDLLVIEDANITTTTTSFTVTITTAITDYIGQYPYSLRDITGGINRVVSSGVVSVQASPNKDA